MPKLPKQPKPLDTQALRAAWLAENTLATSARAASNSTAEWAHLERCHILSQPLAVPHARTHLAMLSYGRRHRDRHEILGQLGRLIVALPGTALRRYPRGNTGGADVSAVAPMPIPSDLAAVLTAH